MKDTPEYRAALKLVEIARTSNVFKFYASKPTEDRFTELMELFDKVNPEWKKIYEEIEKEKPIEVQTPLEYENIQDVIDGALNEPILELCLNIHIANKIAHTYDRAIENIIKKKLIEKSQKSSDNKIQSLLKNHRRLSRLYRQIGDYLDPSNLDDKNARENLLEYIKRDGITEDDLEQLNNIGIPCLIRGRKKAFAAKDYEIDQALTALKQEKDISYGVCLRKVRNHDGSIKTDGRGREIEDSVLVVDVPYYGQYIVHMKRNTSISSLATIPKYSAKYLYEKKTFLLTDNISNKGMDFIESHSPTGKTASYEEMEPHLIDLEKMNPRFAHYLALKYGANKKELRRLHNKNAWER